MAVLIASRLRKEIGGTVLFDGVSFKAARRDRIALSGPNGSGKTTMLRTLAGQLGVDGGDLAIAKGSRIVLHDQRPPREQGISLEDYVVSGATELVAAEKELRRLEQAMADGQYDEATLNAYADAMAALEHAGGYTWREYAASVLRGLGFVEGNRSGGLQGPGSGRRICGVWSGLRLRRSLMVIARPRSCS